MICIWHFIVYFMISLSKIKWIVYLERAIHVFNPGLAQQAQLEFGGEKNVSSAVSLYVLHQELFRLNEI